MGIFRGIKSTYKKSEAAVVVQNLLEQQVSTGLFELSPASTANKLVGGIWDQMPDVYDGKFGQRPHKITVAASALAYGVSITEEGDQDRTALILCLGNVLMELEKNGRFYTLSNLDHELIEAAYTVYLEQVGENSELGNLPNNAIVDDVIKRGDLYIRQTMKYMEEKYGKNFWIKVRDAENAEDEQVNSGILHFYRAAKAMASNYEYGHSEIALMCKQFKLELLERDFSMEVANDFSMLLKASIE